MLISYLIIIWIIFYIFYLIMLSRSPTKVKVPHLFRNVKWLFYLIGFILSPITVIVYTYFYRDE